MGNGTSSFYIRMAEPSDAPQCHAVDLEAWGAESAASVEMFEQRIARYPFGNFVAVDREDGRIIGSVWSVSTGRDPFLTKTWKASTGGAYDGVCDVDGPHIFGVNLATRRNLPAGLNVGRKLTRHCVEAAWMAGKRTFMLGARIPEYRAWQRIFAVDDYVRLFKRGERVFFRGEDGVLRAGAARADLLNQPHQVDPRNWPVADENPSYLLSLDGELGFFLSIRVRDQVCRAFRVLPDYFEDPPSCNYGVLVGWEHPDLE